ncbi:Ig-like domain-containing protein, partial [Listeria sp. ILCC796]
MSIKKTKWKKKAISIVTIVFTISTMFIPLFSNNSANAVGVESGKTNLKNLATTQCEISPTTIDSLTTGSTRVQGTGEPNADIEIRAGEVIIAIGKINFNGSYNFVIPRQPAGTVITARATSNGLTANASTVVIPCNITSTTINSLTTESIRVEGTAEPNADIEIRVSSTMLAIGKVNSSGNYSFLIPKQFAGAIVVAKATKDGRTSSASTVVIQCNIENTFINSLTTDSTSVNGTAEPNAMIVFKDQNNNQIASGVVQANGTYSIAIPKQAFGTVVTATAMKNGKTSSASTTVIQGNIVPTTIGDLTTDSVKAEGTAEPNADMTIKVGQTTIATGRTDASG